MKGKKREIIFLILPALVMISFVVALVGVGIYTSFTDQALIGRAAADPDWVGSKNYTRTLADQDFIISLEKTWWFVLGSAIIGQCGLGLLIAIILKQKGIRGKYLVSAAIISCWIIPDVVAGFMMSSYWSGEGIPNKIFGVFGASPVSWLVRFPLPAVIVANIWRGTGWSMLLFSAALETIPQEYHDAADVDGASCWYKFKTITLRLASPVIIVNLFLITIWTWGYFDLIFIMTGGGPGTATLTYPLLLYRNSFAHFDIGYGAALSVINLLILSVFIAVYLYSFKKVRGR